jgi:predicted enzyme related to lactoylglutathione lyase
MGYYLVSGLLRQLRTLFGAGSLDRCGVRVFNICMTLNSVIFHTSRLAELREFYEEKLLLQTGTYVKENKTVPDYSDSYVNYHLGGTLLCFETEAGRTDIGTIVLNVADFANYRKQVEAAGVKVLNGADTFFKIKDPEGRSLIIEPIRN